MYLIPHIRTLQSQANVPNKNCFQSSRLDYPQVMMAVDVINLRRVFITDSNSRRFSLSFDHPAVFDIRGKKMSRSSRRKSCLTDYNGSRCLVHLSTAIVFIKRMYRLVLSCRVIYYLVLYCLALSCLSLVPRQTVHYKSVKRLCPERSRPKTVRQIVSKYDLPVLLNLSESSAVLDPDKYLQGNLTLDRTLEQTFLKVKLINSNGL